MEFVSRNPGWREERRRVLALPSYTIGEEIANAITHGLGVALAAVGAVVLMMHAPGDALSLASAGVYSLTMFLLYLVSTLYHSLEVCKAKKILSGTRSLHDLSVDRRDVHTNLAALHRRTDGMAACRYRLDSRCDRNRSQCD